MAIQDVIRFFLPKEDHFYEFLEKQAAAAVSGANAIAKFADNGTTAEEARAAARKGKDLHADGLAGIARRGHFVGADLPARDRPAHIADRLRVAGGITQPVERESDHFFRRPANIERRGGVDRCGRPVAGRRVERRAIRAAGLVFGRPAGLPALHATGATRAGRGAGGADVRRPRGDPPLAP